MEPSNEIFAKRILAKCVRDRVTGCLRFMGARNPNGYGSLWVHGRSRSVHRVAHELWVGPIPVGYDIDHVHDRGCRYRDCVEPGHLEAVPHIENLRRTARLRTHCARGHEFSPENTRIVQRNGNPTRQCIPCKRRSARESKMRAKAKKRNV